MQKREGYQQTALNFCSDKPHILATAASTRVHIYKLQKQEEEGFGAEEEEEEEEEAFESMNASQTISKF